MIAKLSEEQRQALQDSPGRPVPIKDERTQKTYYLVEEASYVHLQSLQSDHSRQCHERLRLLIQDGINSPGIPADEAFDRLRTLADQLAQGDA
jgi:hypothetical protein